MAIALRPQICDVTSPYVYILGTEDILLHTEDILLQPVISVLQRIRGVTIMRYI